MMESSGVVIPEVTLNSGHKMPRVGAGTAKYPRAPNDDIKKAVLDAIEAGYRFIDSAALYLTEEGVGAGIEEALKRGLVKSRNELFITTKLWCNNAHPDRVLPAIRESLRKLGLEYVDLYLIHMPVTLKEHIVDMGCKKGEIFPLDIRAVWEAMEEVQKLGLAKSIGVSNFTIKKLTELLAHAKIIPAVNQVEIHPAWHQKKLIEFCKEKGVEVVAYSPLGGKEWGYDVVLGNELLNEIASKKGKTVAQISLRWVYERGVCMVTKSFNKERLRQNLEIFDWKLTEEELKLIPTIPQKRTHDMSGFVFPDSPFKTLEELWDGEM